MAARKAGTSSGSSRASGKRSASGQAKIDDDNRLRELMGLAPRAAPLRADPALEVASKMRSIQGKSAAEVIDILYAGEGAEPPPGEYIHWWGQFSAELPPPFCLRSGGHGYAQARDREHATVVFAGLRNWVLAHVTSKEPGCPTQTKEWAGVTDKGAVWYRWMLADGRQMTVELKKRSQLTASERRAKFKILKR